MPAPRSTPGQPPGPRATLSPDYQRDWPAYFDAVTGKPPRDTVLRALAVLSARQTGASTRHAIDIACGEGRDTRAILAQGPAWHVLAIDGSADGLTRLQASLAPADRARVDVRALAMESIATELAITPPADLINASFALPFCQPKDFPTLWSWLVRTLKPSGLFAGQFFGDRDEWAPVRPQSHHSRGQIQMLLEPFDILHLEEVEKDGDDAMGGSKHHHVFHVVAMKRR